MSNISSYKHLEKALEDLNDTTLIRLVYVSNIRKSSKSDPHLFDHIRTHAEDYNRQNNIKGMLCNNQKYFLQCLEGTKQDMLPLMYRIFRDKRHTKLRIILLKPIENYTFKDWRMRSLNLDERLWLKDSIQERSSELREFIPFNPLQWSEWYTEHFLKTMRKFDHVNEEYEDEIGSYNVIQDPNLQLASMFDSTLVHRILLLMVVVLLIFILRMNRVIA